MPNILIIGYDDFNAKLLRTRINTTVIRMRNQIDTKGCTTIISAQAADFRGVWPSPYIVIRDTKISNAKRLGRAIQYDMPEVDIEIEKIHSFMPGKKKKLPKDRG